MHGQPDRRLLGRRPFDSVASMSRDIQEITGAKLNGPIVEPDSRCSLNDENPFIMRLVVPKASRRSVTVRNDSFNAKTAGGQKRLELFVRKIGLDIGEEICHRRQFQAALASQP
jgi:hypothetical protein